MSVDRFRIANYLDAELITKLVNQAYRPESATPAWTHESNWVAGNRTNISQIMDVIAKSNSIILVGIKGSSIVACVHVEQEGNSSHIGMLAVHPELQGAGAGKQMLSQAEKYALEIFGAEKLIMLVVSSRSELIAFYLRRGYRQTGSIMDYPLALDVGIPKKPNLKIEVLEKWLNVHFDSKPDEGNDGNT